MEEQKIKYEQKTVRAARLSFPEGTVFSFEDFLDVCPYTMEELCQEDRKKDISEWRHIGMCWYAIINLSLVRTGLEFNKNYATVMHSVRVVTKRKNKKSIEDKVNEVLNIKAK